MSEAIANERVKTLARTARIPLPLGGLQRNFNASAISAARTAEIVNAIAVADATATANRMAPVNATCASAVTVAASAHASTTAAPPKMSPAASVPVTTMRLRAFMQASPTVLQGLSPIVPTFFIAICSLPGSNIAVPGAVAGPSYLLLVQALPPLAASTSSFRIRHSQQVSAIEQTFRNDNHVVVSWNGSPNFVIASTSQTLPGRYKIIVTPGH